MELSNEEIQSAVSETVVPAAPKVLTETQKLIVEARAHLSYGFDPQTDDLIERLTNAVQALDKQLEETIALYNKSRQQVSDQGWELENRRQDYYQQRGRDGWL